MKRACEVREEAKAKGLQSVDADLVVRATGRGRQKSRFRQTLEMARDLASQLLAGDMENSPALERAQVIDGLAAALLRADRCGVGGPGGLGHNPDDAGPGAGGTLRPLFSAACMKAEIPETEVRMTGRWCAGDGQGQWTASQQADTHLLSQGVAIWFTVPDAIGSVVNGHENRGLGWQTASMGGLTVRCPVACTGWRAREALAIFEIEEA